MVHCVWYPNINHSTHRQRHLHKILDYIHPLPIAAQLLQWWHTTYQGFHIYSQLTLEIFQRFNPLHSSCSHSDRRLNFRTVFKKGGGWYIECISKPKYICLHYISIFINELHIILRYIETSSLCHWCTSYLLKLIICCCLLHSVWIVVLQNSHWRNLNRSE